MIKDQPMGLTVASFSLKGRKLVKKALENELLRIDTTSDVMGVEMCGAIKNVIAIASGMIDGMNYTDSTKSMFMTKILCDLEKTLS